MTAPLRLDCSRALRRFGELGAMVCALVLPAVVGRAGEQAAPELDQLRLRQGQTIVGTLKDPTLTFRTPYGEVTLETSRVVRLRLGEGETLLDVAFLANSNRVSGYLRETALRFQSESGEEMSVRRERAQELLLRARSPGAAGLSASPLVLLRNGDRLSARLPDRPVRIATARGETSFAQATVASIRFLEGDPVTVKLQTFEGAVAEGQWTDDDLELRLDLGGSLKVHPQRVALVDCRPANRSAAPVVSAEGTRQLPGLVWIAPGEFTLGSPVEEADRELDEGPQTQVRLTTGFWMGQCEVTQAEYRELMENNPSLFVGDLQRPVERVRWRDAVEYCARLTSAWQQAGRLPADHAFRLPTEAEWEYACRAGTTTRFSYGADADAYALERQAWFNENSNASTHPVGTREPNPWGLHDMHGNVLEWCLDGFVGAYPGGTVVDPRAAPEGSLRVARGGSWLYGAKACRSANRDSYGESTRCSDLGFRVVLAPVPTH